MQYSDIPASKYYWVAQGVSPSDIFQSIIYDICFDLKKKIFAGNIVLELSKDKHNASLLDRQLGQFQSSVNKVESELSTQIRYLTQVNTDLCFYVVHCITTHNLLCPIKTICSCTQTRVSQ